MWDWGALDRTRDCAGTVSDSESLARGSRATETCQYAF